MIDVSGSMRTSAHNPGSQSLNRLGDLRATILDAQRRALDSIHSAYPDGVTTQLDIFMYAFGLQHVPTPTCDLLALLRIATSTGLDIPDIGATAEPVRRATSGGDVFEQLDALAAQYGRKGWGEIARDYLDTEQKARNLLRRLQEQPELANQLAALLPRLTPAGVDIARTYKANKGLGMLKAATHPLVTAQGGLSALLNSDQVNEAKALIEHLSRPFADGESAEENLQKLRETVGSRVAAELAEKGDTTLSVEELIPLLESSGTGFAKIEDFIYGTTPMRAAMQEVANRLRREQRRRTTDSAPTIVVVSDGHSTDGDPSAAFHAIRQAGATVVSCYITERNVGEARTFANRPGPDWDDGARLLFEVSSPVQADDPYARHLTRHGWTIPDGARYFVHANHSDHLGTLVEMVLNADSRQ
ncbi:VWA domain-containing protein [Catenulispora yoronensis]